MLIDDRDYIAEIEDGTQNVGPPFCRSLIGEDQIWLNACRQAVQQNRREWLSRAVHESAITSSGIKLINRYAGGLSCRPDAASLAQKLAAVACFAADLNEAISVHQSSGEPIETDRAAALAMDLYGLARYFNQMEARVQVSYGSRVDEFALKAKRIRRWWRKASDHVVAMLSELQLREPGWQLARLRDLILWILDEDPNENARDVSVNALLDAGTRGQVVTLRFQLCQPGDATIYPDPRQMMFFTLDKAGQNSVDTAWEYTRKTFGRNEDVRWSLRHHYKDSSKDLPFTIEGGSLGAAVALGLTHLFDSDLNFISDDWAITGSITFDGRITPVTGLNAKFKAAKDAELKVIIPAKVKSRSREKHATDQLSDEDLKSWRQQLIISEARTVEHASEIATESVQQVIDYLNFVEWYLSQWPPYYPRDFKFDFARIRQKVRVRTRRADDANYTDHSEDGAEPTDTEQVLDWDDVEDVHRGVILGDAGFGKTWLLKYEGWRLARDQRALLENGEIRVNEVKLPIFVLLGDLAHELVGVRNSADVQTAIIRSLLNDRREVRKVRKILNESLVNNTACLLLDGLDEIPITLRRSLVDALENLHCRVLITSRITGYQSLFRPRDDESDRELEVIAFEEPQIGLFIKSWFASLEKQTSGRRRTTSLPDADDRARRLYEFLIDNPTLLALARIPLLLTFICHLAREPSELPSGRIDLYRDILRSLLDGRWRLRNERREVGQTPRKLEILKEVAWHFARNERGETWIDPMPAVELAAVIKSKSRKDDPPDLLETLSERDGILTRDVEPPYPAELDVPYRFLHPTFREFLVAEYLAARSVEEWQKVVLQHCWDSDWENVIVLLAGMLNPKGVTHLLRTLLDQHDPFNAMLFLAGDCLGEVTPSDREKIGLAGEINRRLEDLLLSPNKKDREQSLRVLTRTGVLSSPAVTQVGFDDLPSTETDSDLGQARNAEETAKARQSLDDLLAGLKRADKQTRLNIVQELSQRTETQALVALRLILNDEDRGVRKRACEALGRRRDSQAVPALLELLLRERDNNVLTEAALALGKIGDPRATEVLIGLLSQDNSVVQLHAISALRMLRDPRAEPFLVEVLLDTKENPGVRAEAASALGLLDQASAAEALFQGIKENDAGIRKASIKSLGNLREERAIEDLVRLLCDNNSAVAVAAAEALKSIAGELTKAEMVYDAAVNRLHEAQIIYFKDQRCRRNVHNLLAGIAPHVSAANKAEWPARRARYARQIDPR